MEKLQGVQLPYDIDDTVYYMEKFSDIGGTPKYKVTKCFMYGYFNYGDGWKMKLRTNRNKYKDMEYDTTITSNEYVVFVTKNKQSNA